MRRYLLTILVILMGFAFPSICLWVAERADAATVEACRDDAKTDYTIKRDTGLPAGSYRVYRTYETYSPTGGYSERTVGPVAFSGGLVSIECRAARASVTNITTTIARQDSRGNWSSVWFGYEASPRLVKGKKIVSLGGGRYRISGQLPAVCTGCVRELEFSTVGAGDVVASKRYRATASGWIAFSFTVRIPRGTCLRLSSESPAGGTTDFFVVP